MRYVLASTAVLSTAVFLVFFAYGFAVTPDTIDIVDYDAYRATALNFVRDDAKLFVDAGMLVLAGLWSVAIVSKRERIRREDVPEIIMFVCATILLATFFLCAQRYGQELENAYWSVGTLSKQKGFPDINSPYLRLYSSTVIGAFYLSLFVSAVTVLSLCVFRKDEREQMTRLLTFIVFAAFVSLSAYAQKMETAIDKDCPQPTRYSHMAKMVSQANPKVPDNALKTDGEVIKEARGSLDKYFAKGGFNHCDVDQVIELTWIQLRKENGQQNFTQSQFAQEAREYGGLRIKSTPGGATIWVDNAQWEKPTNAGRMTHVGTRKIKLHLEGYDDSFGEKEVLANQWADYVRTLNKKQK